MKRIILFKIVVLAFSFYPIKSNAMCFGPNYQAFFNKTVQNIAVQKNDQFKLNIALDFVSNNCFGSTQLNQFLYLLQFDANKLKLAKEAYFLMDDTLGFSTAVYAFESNTYKNYFEAFLQEQQQCRNEIILDFPDLNYPNAAVYRGITYAPNYVSDYIFNQLSILVFNEKSDFDKKSRLHDIMSKYVLSVEQFMKLLTIIDRLDLRFALGSEFNDQLYDLENAPAIEAVFGNTNYKYQFRNLFVKSNVGHTYRREEPRVGYTYRRPETEISPAEMSNILQNIKNEPFSTNRLMLAKTIIQGKGAISTAQVQQIMSLMAFDSHKLELAKFAFRYAVDKENYFKACNSLTFSTNRDALLRFISDNN